MKKIGIFYGSSGGTCEGIALTIASKLALGRDDVHDVAKAKAEDATACDVLLLGSSTWGAGDLQDDWFDFLPQLKAAGLAGKVVALFGCGDSASFGDTFCDAIGTLHDELAATGCRFVGEVDTAGYTFDASTAVKDGRFVGLALDEVNEPQLTDGRIDGWIAAIKGALD